MDLLPNLCRDFDVFHVVFDRVAAHRIDWTLCHTFSTAPIDMTLGRLIELSDLCYLRSASASFPGICHRGTGYLLFWADLGGITVALSSQGVPDRSRTSVASSAVSLCWFLSVSSSTDCSSVAPVQLSHSDRVASNAGSSILSSSGYPHSVATFWRLLAIR